MESALIGLAMMISTASGPLTPRAAQTVPTVAFTFELPAGIDPANSPRSLMNGPSREKWRRNSSPLPQAAPARRYSPTDRVIAVAAGVCVGWVVGGAIGYKLTDNPDNPSDDTSGLRGVIIGAPLGSAVGAILGWTLTDR